jgi:hypothetical protein
MKTKMPTLLRRTGASRTASKCQGQVPGQRKTITGWVGGGGGGGFVSIHTMEGLKAQAGKKEAMMESHYYIIAQSAGRIHSCRFFEGEALRLDQAFFF